MLQYGRMGEDQDRWPEAVFTRRDGERTHAIVQASQFGCIVILMASALAITIIPESWIQSDMLMGITDALRGGWPKLDHDVAQLQAEDPARGQKYAVFAAYCAAVTLIFSIVAAPTVWRAIGRSSVRLTFPQSGALWKIPVALAVLDHDEFGLNQPKLINVIGILYLARDRTENRYPLFLITRCPVDVLRNNVLRW